VLPVEGAGFWPLVSMGAVLGGTLRAPLTAIVFALELTHDVNVLLPLLLAVTVSHAVSVLLLKRSILTEKISRRGYHLSSEYAVDPLEIIFAREVVRTSIVALPADASRADAAHLEISGRREQRLFPVVDGAKRLVGVITKRDLRQWIQMGDGEGELSTVMQDTPVTARLDEPLRAVVFRMAETGLTRLPVLAADGALVGMLALTDLLVARTRLLEAERRRERVLGSRFRLPTVFSRSA
jgi:CBS domain-containing protein